MAQFVLLYRNTNEAYQENMGSPERAKASLAKWRAWIKDMTEKGQLKSVGEPLERVGKVVRGRKKMVTDGPYTESKDVIGGFSIVEARNLEEAAKIASACPVLDGDGSVEVRPVLKIDI